VKSVKEQRVNGSYWIKPIQLRCTLMGFERNHQVKIPSKQLKLVKFSTLNTNPKLNPWFVTGLIDAEGSFNISIYRSNTYKLGWGFQAKFQINLHIRDLSLLLQLQQFFGGIGSIIKNKTRNEVIYSVSRLKDLITIIIPHFYKYSLLTQKAADFILFTRAIEIVKKKEHLSIDGLYKIINIKSSINLGLSDDLKYHFNQFTPVERPVVLTPTNNIDHNWIAGFTTGEGNFYIDISKSKSHKIGYQVQLNFRIYQHKRDLKLIELLIKSLGAGNLEKNTINQIVSLRITQISEIIKIVIPLFNKNQIHGVKYLDYLDFCKVAKLINEGKHLTIEGLDLIRTIKAGMNTKRKIY
jgi:hypothetical protein